MISCPAETAAWCPSPVDGLLLEGLKIAGAVWLITWLTRKALENVGLAKSQH
ncbi:hypothetical protein HYT95_02325 [Candidatus Peregrinibacteria bacterium]|nr:hypothetical protein [Candidatus Peregrinibacteria bacterium]